MLGYGHDGGGVPGSSVTPKSPVSSCSVPSPKAKGTVCGVVSLFRSLRGGGGG